MRKKIASGIFALIGLSGIAVLGGTTELISSLVESVQNNPITRIFAEETGQTARDANISSKTNIQKDDDVPLTKVPEHILWSVIFSLPKRLDSEAEKARLAGEDDSLWKNYFVRQAKVSTTTDQILREMAVRYSEDIGPIDEQARAAIQDIRAKNPTLEAFNANGVVPSSLVELQLKKDEIALRNRDSFRNEIGEEEFAKFSEFLITEFTKGFIRQDLKQGESAPVPNDENNGFKPFLNPDNGGNRK